MYPAFVTLLSFESVVHSHWLQYSYLHEIPGKYIYMANIAENINAGLGLMRMEPGCYFPSMRSLEINLFIQLSNLNN